MNNGNAENNTEHKDYKDWLIGWLSPEGRFVECGFRDHIPAAEEILRDLGIREDDDPADQYLSEHGWVKLTCTEVAEHKWSVIFPMNTWKLSWEQHSFLKPYIEENIGSISGETRLFVQREFELE